MCQQCDDARNWPGTNSAKRYTPACIFCGARMIKEIGKFKRPREELIEQRKDALARWVSAGHSEAEIRRLVALNELPLAEMTTTQTKRGK